MHVVTQNKSRNHGLRGENALDSKPQKQNDHWDEFERKHSMFTYIYQSFNPGKNRLVNRISAALVELKPDTWSDDETKLHTPSVMFKNTEVCGSSETWKKWGWRVGFHSIPPAVHWVSVHGYSCWEYSTSLRHGPHTDRQRHTRWGYFTALLQAWHRNKVRSFLWSSN